MKVCLLDDHQVIRSLVGKKIEEDIGAEVTRLESLEQLSTSLSSKFDDIDVYIIDLSLEDGTGFSALDMLSEHNITNNIIYTSNTEPGIIKMLTKHKYICGVVSKASSEDELLQAIKSVDNGKSYYCTRTNQILNTKRVSFWDLNKDEEKLTPREIEILELMWQGLTSVQISNRLNISIHTTENHRKNIKRKLKQDSQVGILRTALQRGYINTMTEF